MKNIIKEIPLVIFLGIFSIPIVLGDFANKTINIYIDWAWEDLPYTRNQKEDNSKSI